METQRFHLGDLLSITTGKLLSPSHMEGIYSILNWMTGDELFTHQLPRAMDECAPYLREQFPSLEGVTADDVTLENCKQWLADAVERHGEWFDVAPAPAGCHESRRGTG